MTDNWYIILELEIDPPIEDEEVIENRIKEKSRFWSTHFNDFKMGAQYRKWQQNISQIRKDMIGESNIREQLAKEASKQLYSQIDKLIKSIGRKGNITSAEGNKLAEKFNLSIEVIKKRAVKLNVQWKDAGESKDYKMFYDKYYKTKPNGSAVFDGMKQMLKSFNVDNLYDFLYKNSTIKNANNLPCKTLWDRAVEKKKTEFYKTDNISGTGAKLCEQCKLTFKDEKNKAVYDRYVTYNKIKTTLEYAKNVAEISGSLTQELGEETIEHLTQLFKNRTLAQEILIAFCKIENVNYNITHDNTKTKNLKVCRCGAISDVSDGRTVCSTCGMELSINCPSCGNKNDATVKICKCGFNLENIDKAIALYEQAEYEIKVLDFKMAKMHLDEAQNYWKDDRRTERLENKLLENEKKAGARVLRMQKAVASKMFFEAKSYYDSIRKLFTGYKNYDIERDITQGLLKTKEFIVKAKAAKTRSEKLEFYSKAYNECKDYPGLKELMPPPKEVTGVKVSVNQTARHNVISWDTIEDKSINFVVVRSVAQIALNVSDGEIIYEGDENTFIDKDIKPAIPYFYNVFTKRDSDISKGANCELKEAINFFEIVDVQAVPLDGSIEITWGDIPSASKVDVYMLNSQGGERQIISTQKASHIIENLVNDTTYKFRIALNYTVNGVIHKTSGVVVFSTPTSPPTPIETIKIRPIREDEFEVVWNQEENYEVKLYYSNVKPKLEVGELITSNYLKKELNLLQTSKLSDETQNNLKRNEKGLNFVYHGTQSLYIVPVVVKLDSYIAGFVGRVSKNEIAQIQDVRILNNQISMFIKRPVDAIGFVVMYRFDKFPIDMADKEATSKYLTVKQYELNNAIILDGVEPKKYYFSIYSQFKREGGEDFSSGCEYIFDNLEKTKIVYSISVSKKLFGENSVAIEFEAQSRSFTLPDIEIMYSVGKAPVFKKSSTLFYEINSTKVDGVHKVKIPINKSIPKDAYIKAFIKDETKSDAMLQLKLKSDYKIT